MFSLRRSYIDFVQFSRFLFELLLRINSIISPGSRILSVKRLSVNINELMLII